MIWFLAAVTVAAAGLAGHAQYSATRKDRTIGDLVAMVRTEQQAQRKDIKAVSGRVDDVLDRLLDHVAGLDEPEPPAPVKKAAPARTLAPSKKAAPRPKGPVK